MAANFELEQFIADCRTALATDPSHKLVREVVARAVSDPPAVLKALGVGLLYPPRRVNVLADGRKPHVVSALGRNWLVREVAAPVGYAAAVAIEQPKCRLRWRQWNVQA